MHDAFLKSVFADRRMTEILIRRHAPEWASEIDFSTLREESTGLVSNRTHQRRHPDMIWSADTVKGERVLFLLEFQRKVERLMALRTTTYTALTLEGVAAGPDFRPGDPLPEFVYLVPVSRRRTVDRTATGNRLVPALRSGSLSSGPVGRGKGRRPIARRSHRVGPRPGTQPFA